LGDKAQPDIVDLEGSIMLAPPDPFQYIDDLPYRLVTLILGWQDL
jgi:hypothetical protein